MKFLVLAALLALGPSAGTAAAQPAHADAPRTAADQCIQEAAVYHGVSAELLRAILQVETRMRPTTVVKNRNGSIDVGISGINSIHFRELSRWNIAPSDLLDACIGTYVGAWHLARTLENREYSWETVARYHSATPYFNRRYQIMIWNELLRAGVVQGKRLPVPPLDPAASPKATKRSPSTSDNATGLVFDLESQTR